MARVLWQQKIRSQSGLEVPLQITQLNYSAVGLDCRSLLISSMRLSNLHPVQPGLEGALESGIRGYLGDLSQRLPALTARHFSPASTTRSDRRKLPRQLSGEKVPHITYNFQLVTTP